MQIPWKQLVNRRQAHGGNVAVALVLALAWSMTSALPAGAVGDWDPDDVRGRFDLRWIGAGYTADGDIRLTASFYPGFRIWDLPRKHESFIPGVWFDIDTYFTGWFFRHDGRVRFAYGDTGSNCCLKMGARIVDPFVLRVTFPPFDEAEAGIPIRGHSRWGGLKGPHDWTGILRLPPPP